MEVTAVELRRSQKPGIVKAFGKATLNNEVVLDILIMDKEDNSGAWATFPNGKKGQDGKWYSPVFFKTKELDQAFKAKVVEEYNSLGGAPATGTGTGAPAASADSLPF